MKKIEINKISELENEFFSTDIWLSYSGLNKLLTCPQEFYKWYVLNQKEDALDSHLIEGSLIHCLILEPHKFEDYFILEQNKLPSDNTIKLLKTIYENHKDDLVIKELIDYKDEILEYLKEVNLHQSIKDDNKRLEKVCDIDSERYFNFLKKAENKKIINEATLNKCQEIADKIKNDEKISNILCLNKIPSPELDFSSEIYLDADLGYKTFKVHGSIDRLVVDYLNKKINIIDIKKLSKYPLDKFNKVIKDYNYWLQAGLYYKLVEKNLNLDYEINFIFVVADMYNQVYPFYVSEVTMNTWLHETNLALEKADYHLKERNFYLPYEFLTGNVML